MDAQDVGCGTGAIAYLMTTIVGPDRGVALDHRPARLTRVNNQRT
jgi:ubiquinone/menaquinone biosynthesis C-methylase UbiE